MLSLGDLRWPKLMVVALCEIRLLPETLDCPEPERSWGKPITEARS